MTSPPWYLRIKNPAMLDPTDNFLDPEPLFDHDDFSTTQPQSLTYARFCMRTNAIKGNLSDVCSAAPRCSNMQVLQQLSASFAPVTDLCWFTVLPRIHQRSTAYLQNPSKSVCLFAHMNRESKSDDPGLESIL